MIVEGAVLLGVQHLQQRRRRIAAEVGRHLVDLVQQEHRVLRAGLLERLDDLARQRADVRAPVAADLGLVAHAAQRQPHELAPRRVRDRARQRGLADAGRPDQAQDRPLELLHQRLHGEVLEDALLDLLEAVVVLVEDPLGLDDVQLLLGLLAPGQRQHPVDVVAHHRRLGRHRRHHAQLLQLLLDLGLRLLRQVLLLGALLQLGQLVLELVAVAELLLDRLHLLVEVVLLLRLLHLLLDARPDLLLDLQDLDLRLHQLVEARQPLRRRVHLEDRLLVGQLELQLPDHRVGQLAGILDGLHRDQDLGRDALVELDVGLEGRVHLAHQRVQLDRLLGDVGQLLDLDGEEAVGLREAPDGGAPLALDQHLHRAVGQAQQLDDRPDRADREDVLGHRLVGLGLALRAEEDLLVAALAHRLFERADRLFAPHEQRHHHVREHDDVPQREQRHPARNLVSRRPLALGHRWLLNGGKIVAQSIGTARGA